MLSCETSVARISPREIEYIRVRHCMPNLEGIFPLHNRALTSAGVCWAVSTSSANAQVSADSDSTGADSFFPIRQIAPLSKFHFWFQLFASLVQPPRPRSKSHTWKGSGRSKEGKRELTLYRKPLHIRLHRLRKLIKTTMWKVTLLDAEEARGLCPQPV